MFNSSEIKAVPHDPEISLLGMQHAPYHSLSQSQAPSSKTPVANLQLARSKISVGD